MTKEAKIGGLYRYKFDNFEATPAPFAVIGFAPRSPQVSPAQLNMIYTGFKKQTPFLLVDKWSDKKYNYYKILFTDQLVELGMIKPRDWSVSFAEIGQNKIHCNT